MTSSFVAVVGLESDRLAPGFRSGTLNQDRKMRGDIAAPAMAQFEQLLVPPI
jgi:hypothetical protein